MNGWFFVHTMRFLIIVAAVCASFLLSPPAKAQGLTVYPVTIEMLPGEMATTITMTNMGNQIASFQIRPFAWSEGETGSEQLVPTDAFVASPPLGTMAPGSSQIVRLVFRQPALGREASYRILLDEIPPPAAPGTVNIALRLSIPIFVDPPTRIFPHLRWSVENVGGQSFLVAVNDGTRHQAVRDIRLTTAFGAALKVEANGVPYILAGATRRWHITTPGALPAPGSVMHLSAHTGFVGTIDQMVPVSGSP
jgi:fimbrial chaperone protein